MITTIEDFRKDIEKRQNINQLYKNDILSCQKTITENTRKLGYTKDLGTIIDGIVRDKRQGMKIGIENVMSNALKLLYDGSYSVEMDYCIKNNRSCLDINICKETEEGKVKRDMDGCGGGVCDSISIPMRVLVLSGSDSENILFLDEAFKHIGVNKSERVGMFLKTLAQEMNMQIILLSHDKKILEYADKGYFLEYRNDKVFVTQDN